MSLRRHLAPAGRIFFAACAAAFVQSCSGSGDGSTGTGNAAITLALGPTAETIAPGTVAEVSATVTRSGDFTGAVTFAVTGAPSGVSTLIGDMTTVGTTSTVIVLVTAQSTAAVGTYPLTVTASGSGVSDASQTYALTLSASATSYAFDLNAATTTIAAGASGNLQVTIHRNGFTGSVNLSVPNLPTGVTATFAPNNTTDTLSTLTLAVGSSAAAGSYLLSVSGVAAGQANQTIFFTLTVPATGSFSLAAVPALVSVAQGASSNVAITFTRSGGFTGTIALAAVGNPAQLTATFNPASVTGTTSTLTFAAGSALAAGTYPVTIQASSPGVSSVTQVVNVTVTASAGGGGGSISIDYSACTAAQRPAWFAYQDGSGPWTAVPAVNNVYSFTITSAKGAYASAVSSTTTQVSVLFFAKSDLSGVQLGPCAAATTGNTVNGTVAGLASGLAAEISLGNVGVDPPFPNTTFTLNNVQTGTHDLLGYRTSILNGPSTSDRVILRRDQNIPNNGSLALMDFGSAEAVAPATGILTVNGTGGTPVTVQMSYLTGASCNSGALYFPFATTPAPVTIFGVPAAQQRSTDFHIVTVGLTAGANTTVLIQSFHTLASRSVTLPASISAPVMAVLAGNYKRLQATFTAPADYNAGAGLTYFDGTGTKLVSINATAAWLGGTSAVIAMPVFSGVGVWVDAWAPPAGVNATWIVTAGGVTNGGVGAPCIEGYQVVNDQVTGSN